MPRWRRAGLRLAIAFAVAVIGPAEAAASQVAVIVKSGGAVQGPGSFKVGPIRAVEPGVLGGPGGLSLSPSLVMPAAAPLIPVQAARGGTGAPALLTGTISETAVPSPAAGALSPEAVPAIAGAQAVLAGSAQAAPSAGALASEAGSILAQETSRGRVADPVAGKGLWDGFWSRAKAAPGEVDLTAGAGPAGPAALEAAGERSASGRAEPPAPGPASPAPKAAPKAAKGFIVPAILGALYAAARFGVPAFAPGAWAAAAPFVASGGILAATFALNRLMRAGVAALGLRLGWQAGTVVAVRLAAGVVLWGAGGALALHAAGVSTAALLATFGIGGVAMTMAAKEFIGNFLEGLKILAARPFVIGDRIRIGTAVYKVKDLGLRYMELEREGGGVTMMTYAQLSEKPVTVFGEYAGRREAAGRGSPRRIWSDVHRVVRELPRMGILASSLWTILGLGLAAALPFMPALLPFKLAVNWLAYVQGAATLAAAHSLEKGAVGFLRRLAEKRGWSPQSAAVAKLGVQAAIYLVGGSAALRFFGMTWKTLLASLGATSIALGWASSDVIGNLIQGFWILMNHPFTIGDRLEVGTVSGAVIDMNLNYVVLGHGDGSHTLLPYAAIKGSAFTVLPK